MRMMSLRTAWKAGIGCGGVQAMQRAQLRLARHKARAAAQQQQLRQPKPRHQPQGHPRQQASQKWQQSARHAAGLQAARTLHHPRQLPAVKMRKLQQRRTAPLCRPSEGAARPPQPRRLAAAAAAPAVPAARPLLVLLLPPPLPLPHRSGGGASPRSRRRTHNSPDGQSNTHRAAALPANWRRAGRGHRSKVLEPCTWPSAVPRLSMCVRGRGRVCVWWGCGACATMVHHAWTSQAESASVGGPRR